MSKLKEIFRRNKVLKDTYGDDCLEKAYKKYAFKQKDMNSFEDGIIDDKYLEIRE